MGMDQKRLKMTDVKNLSLTGPCAALCRVPGWKICASNGIRVLEK